MLKETVRTTNSLLKQYQHVRGNVKFSYGVMKNIKIFADEADVLDSVIKPYTEKEEKIKTEHEAKVNKLRKEVKAMKLSDSEASTIFAEKVVPLNREMEKQIEKLEKEEEKLLADFKKTLEEEIEIEPYKIPFDAFEGLYVLDNKGVHHPVEFSAYEMGLFEPIIKEG